MLNNKGKKWSEEEENTLLELLRNKNTLEECSNSIGRTSSAIKIRIEEIIYKKNVYENQSFNELSFLKKYVDIGFDEIIKKYGNKNNYKNKLDKKIEKIYVNNFEEKVLNELEKIRLKQEDHEKNILDILKEKNKEINRLNLIIDDFKKNQKKNENTIIELVKVVKKININNIEPDFDL